VLEVGKWSCLGIYLFMESCTIVCVPFSFRRFAPDGFYPMCGFCCEEVFL
jgi:hypothetical protein